MTYEEKKPDALGPFSIGSSHWSGLSKLIEESGEVMQVAGKLLGTGGEVHHWDGSNLRDKLEEELADLMAAVFFVIEHNKLDENKIRERGERKLKVFEKWHDQRAEHPLPCVRDGKLEAGVFCVCEAGTCPRARA